MRNKARLVKQSYELSRQLFLIPHGILKYVGGDINTVKENNYG